MFYTEETTKTVQENGNTNIRNSTGITNTSNSRTEDYYYNYNNKAHGAGRVIAPEDGERIRNAYVDNVGTLTGAVARMIEQAISSGLTVEEVIMAIEETGFAPQPSPWYLRAVLKNWVENGVTVSKVRHIVAANRGVRWWNDD